jgi:hypothetical protein
MDFKNVIKGATTVCALEPYKRTSIRKVKFESNDNRAFKKDQIQILKTLKSVVKDVDKDVKALS